MFTVPKDTKPNSDNIKNAIDYNEGEENVKRKWFLKLDDYYRGIQDITNRKKEGLLLKNNKVTVNFARYISDLYVGYLFGNPIDIVYKDNVPKKTRDNINKALDNQNIDIFNSSMGHALSKFGVNYEYIFADEEADPRSAKIDPQNCVVVYDDTMNHNKLFSITYSGVSGTQDGEKYHDVVVTDSSKIQEYNEDLKPNGTPREHHFKAVPIVEYHNTEDCQGDFECVLSLIDAYNILQSDRINDKEQLVEAIMVLYGAGLTPDQREDLKLYRTVNFPAKKDGNQIEFLTKTLSEDQIDVLRKSIEDNIHKISKVPNMSDEKFAGNASGVAIDYKKLPFEWQTKTKERFFEKGVKERILLYNNFFQSKSDQSITMSDFDVVFHRSLPNNDFETSQMILNLDNKVSDETLIGRLSFVSNVEEELKKVDEQKKENMDLLNKQFGSVEPSNDNNDPNNSNNQE